MKPLCLFFIISVCFVFEASTSELEFFQVKVQAIEAMMEKIDDEIVLVADWDDTLYRKGDDIAIRNGFKDFVNKWRQQNKLKLVIVTSNPMEPAAWCRFSKCKMPDPDYLIVMSLQHDYFNIQARPGLTINTEMVAPEFMRDHFPDAKVYSEGLELPEFVSTLNKLIISEEYLQPLIVANKLPIEDIENCIGEDPFIIETKKFTHENDRLAQSSIDLITLKQLDEKCLLKFGKECFNVFGCFLNVSTDNNISDLRGPGEEPEIYDQDFILLTFLYSKGGLLSQLAKPLGLKGKVIFAAGNGSNDTDMLDPVGSDLDYHVSTGIVVGNASNTLKKGLSDKPHVVFCEKDRLTGVMEGFETGLKRHLSGTTNASKTEVPPEPVEKSGELSREDLRKKRMLIFDKKNSPDAEA